MSSILNWIRKVYDVKYNGDPSAVLWELALYVGYGIAVALIWWMCAGVP